VFTDPQLGRVGVTETEARAAGRDIRVAVLPMSAVARAIETGEMRGSMKVIVDAASKHILGAAVFGIDGGEIMGAMQIAIMGQVPYPVLRDGIFAHPTLMESLNNLFSAL
jgi:pyruvate/2-oxoglutarate dehydrogenase complex dihydrolipoamide dehydrogenase (E3) component